MYAPVNVFDFLFGFLYIGSFFTVLLPFGLVSRLRLATTKRFREAALFKAIHLIKSESHQILLLLMKHENEMKRSRRHGTEISSASALPSNSVLDDDPGQCISCDLVGTVDRRALLLEVRT